MRRLRVSRVVAAPVDVVWTVLISVDQWPKWGPSVRAVECETPRIAAGTRGHIVTAVGLRLPFEITRFDPGHAWWWKVGGMQATDHAVEPTPTGTRISFGVPWPAAPYLTICAVALRRIEQLAMREAAR
jgi:hypothetical protein